MFVCFFQPKVVPMVDQAHLLENIEGEHMKTNLTTAINSIMEDLMGDHHMEGLTEGLQVIWEVDHHLEDPRVWDLHQESVLMDQVVQEVHQEWDLVLEDHPHLVVLWDHPLDKVHLRDNSLCQVRLTFESLKLIFATVVIQMSFCLCFCFVQCSI